MSPNRSIGFTERLQAGVSALVGRPALWLLFVAVLASWPVAWSLTARVPAPLPVLARLPDFRLVDQLGQPFGSKDLAGRVWLASFIFTRCETVCPAITAQMARIQGRTRNLEPAFHLVSFSVDPAYDTPERLAEYARVHRASPRMWSFLTGPAEAVKATVVEGLKVSVGTERPPGGGPEEIFHGTWLVLVDGQGRIRGYYESGAPDAVDRAVRDAALLVNRHDAGREER